MSSGDGRNAGYSGTPLIRKLGIKAGFAMAAIGAPDHYGTLLGELPEGVEERPLENGGLDFIHYFATGRAALEQALPSLRSAIRSDGMIWVSWPKKASGVETDLSGNVVREIALANRLVDVKVCAVDSTWSGLKLVIRVRDR